MQPQKIFLKDYTPATFDLLQTQLHFDLHEDFCRVSQTSVLKKVSARVQDLDLDGEGLELVEIKINGVLLTPSQYEVHAHGLRLFKVPEEFQLEITTKIFPQNNTSLEGLYKVGGLYCTQCEAQGFRKITYFMDRPDVMTTYEVTIEADQNRYPILLSNGDRLREATLPHGRHQVRWRDPYKKPCYLFALVAGDLGVLRDTYTTASGKNVNLEIYSRAGTQQRCQHAMESLKKSMRWDEQRFGREYDLSTYMILAVDDFNAGAMENKGLNIFNSKLVFADPSTATDKDYDDIESVVAHEYFHNWTGNRVTLRDWFHLSLKEGLTVFRDQEFSMDMSSRASVRIDNVADLRAGQFAEDAGPNAHPIRPESCYAVDNFFTSTIYEKGAEVIRMMQTLVGRPGFRKGMDLYFARHDGQAVIIEDFAKAIADANNQDWSQFKLWYSQAGTPVVHVQENYDDIKKCYTLTLSQKCAPTPGQPIKAPFHIPLVMGLLSANGQEMALNQSQVSVNSEGQTLLHLTHAQQSWIFENIATRPVLSINRQFSAPIHIEREAPLQDLIFLFENDSDAFNKWDAAQQVEVREFKNLFADPEHTVAASFLTALKKVLMTTDLPEDFRGRLLHLPDDSYLSQIENRVDGQALLRARISFEKQITQAAKNELLSLYELYHGQNVFSKSTKDFGKRLLKNSALSLLASQPTYMELAQKQFQTAQIMTDEIAAFAILCDQEGEARAHAIAQFYNRWKNETLVLNKWFGTQALARSEQTFSTVVALMSHPDFTLKNPNRVYSLLARFGDNFPRFHDPTQDTYTFMSDQIITLDKINPQVATRVAGCFDVWTKLPENQKAKAHRELERMVRSGLSKNTFEIVSKQLEA